MQGCYLHAPEGAEPLDSVLGEVRSQAKDPRSAARDRTVEVDVHVVAAASELLDRCAAFFNGDRRSEWAEELGETASELRRALRARSSSEISSNEELRRATTIR